MTKLYRKNQKATVCAKDNCVTVYGDTAKVVNAIAVVTVSLIALSLLDKAFR